MRVLGFSAQKPLYQAWQKDVAPARQWEVETYSSICTEASAPGTTIYLVDESEIRSDYHTGTTRVPRVQTPVASVPDRRFPLNMISALSPQGEFRFMPYHGSIMATVFREFLKRLTIGVDKPVFVIVDAHPHHKAKLVWAATNRCAGGWFEYHCIPYGKRGRKGERYQIHWKVEGRYHRDHAKRHAPAVAELR